MILKIRTNATHALIGTQKKKEKHFSWSKIILKQWSYDESNFIIYHRYVYSMEISN